MPINLTDKSRFKEKFRLVANPQIAIMGVVNEPPEEIRFSNNSVVRMLEVEKNKFVYREKKLNILV